MIATLAIALTLALLLGMLAQRLRLSPLVGYLVAGMLAAQPWSGTAIDEQMVAEFSHIGVILLLFGVGLQFHFKDLLAVQKVAVPGSLFCMTLITSLGMLAFYLLGMGEHGWLNGLMYGLCICVSSTVVLTRVLTDNKVFHTPAGHTALGWLVCEDIFTIVLLVLLPAVFSGQALAPALGMMALKLVLLIALMSLPGRSLITKTLTAISRSGSGELFTLAVLVCALGIAVVSSAVFNASMEFGAFLSGMIVGQSRFASRAASDALPMRDAFAVLFFVSVGLGFKPAGMLEHWALALATFFICFSMKPLGACFVMHLQGKPLRLAAMVGGSLSQIGEFSFILATLIAGTYKMLPAEAANVITGVAICTIVLNAALYRFVPSIVNRLEARGIGQRPVEGSVPPPGELRDRIILVGYGPTGELLGTHLRRFNIDVVVVEMNIDTVNRLAKAGIPALLGDARRRAILSAAGVEKAVGIIITAPAAPALQISEAAKALNPDIYVMAHTTYIRNAVELRRSGVQEVYSGEAEVAFAMLSRVLRVHGATEEQVNLTRQGARRQFFGELKAQATASDEPKSVLPQQ